MQKTKNNLTREKTYTILKTYLNQNGYDLILENSKELYQPYFDVVYMSNKEQTDIFIDLISNAGAKYNLSFDKITTKQQLKTYLDTEGTKCGNALINVVKQLLEKDYKIINLYKWDR